MATAARARFVAPDVRTCVLDAETVGQLGDVPRGLARCVRTSDPLEGVRINDTEGHRPILRRAVSGRVSLSSGVELFHRPPSQAVMPTPRIGHSQLKRAQAAFAS